MVVVAAAVRVAVQSTSRVVVDVVVHLAPAVPQSAPGVLLDVVVHLAPVVPQSTPRVLVDVVVHLAVVPHHIDGVIVVVAVVDRRR